jgi:hypothetical protein
MNMPITPRELVEQYAEDSIRDGALFAAEGARIVCHVEFESVPTIYDVVAELYTAAHAMQTASQNMIRDLTQLAGEASLYDTRPDGDPNEAIETAKGHLARAASRAGQLGLALQEAQNALGSVGHRE